MKKQVHRRNKDIGPARAKGRERVAAAVSRIFSIEPAVRAEVYANAHGGVFENARGVFSTHGVTTGRSEKKNRPKGARPLRQGHLEKERHERWHPSNVAARAHERERCAQVWEKEAYRLAKKAGIDPWDAKSPPAGMISKLEEYVDTAETHEARTRWENELSRAREQKRVAACWGRAHALRHCQSGIVATDSDGTVVQGKRGSPLRKVAHCDRRECPDCCRRRERAAKRRAQRILDETGADSSTCLHVTLTQKDVAGRSLDESIRALDGALTRFRKSVWFARNVFAALVRIEWTRSTRETREKIALNNERRALDAAAVGDVVVAGRERTRAASIRARAGEGSWYHVHAHVLVIPRVADDQQGPAMACDAALARAAAGKRPRPQPARIEISDIAAAWQASIAATGAEGGQAWVAPWSPRRNLLAELVKYLAKPADLRALRKKELQEALFALDGARTLRGWGAWREMAATLTRQDLSHTDETDDESAGERDAKRAAVSAGDEIVGWRYVRGRQRPIAAGKVVWRQEPEYHRKALDILWERERRARMATIGQPWAAPDQKNVSPPSEKVAPGLARLYLLPRRA